MREEARQEEIRAEQSAQQSLARIGQRLDEFHEHARNGYGRYWREPHGVSDYLIQRYMLGVCPTDVQDPWIPAGLVIPYNRHGDLTYVQYRPFVSPDPASKYRGPVGVPTRAFHTEPDEEVAGKDVLLVEGAKKAMITWMAVGHRLLVVAIPSVKPSWRVLEEVSAAKRIYVGVDPDAYLPANDQPPAIEWILDRLEQTTEAELFTVRFPLKPDDMITQLNATSSDMLAYINQAVAYRR